MTFTAGAVANFIGIPNPWLIQVIGIGLIAFSLRLFQIGYRGWVQRAEALMITTSDFLWVAGSVLLLVVWSELFSRGGMVLIGAVAAVVLVFGELQAVALRKSRTAAEA